MQFIYQGIPNKQRQILIYTSTPTIANSHIISPIFAAIWRHIQKFEIFVTYFNTPSKIKIKDKETLIFLCSFVIRSFRVTNKIENFHAALSENQLPDR